MKTIKSKPLKIRDLEIKRVPEVESMREFVIRVDTDRARVHHFIVETIIGEEPMVPKIGERVTLPQIANIVRNGNIVTLFPGTQEKKKKEPEDEDIPF